METKGEALLKPEPWFSIKSLPAPASTIAGPLERRSMVLAEGPPVMSPMFRKYVPPEPLS